MILDRYVCQVNEIKLLTACQIGYITTFINSHQTIILLLLNEKTGILYLIDHGL